MISNLMIQRKRLNELKALGYEPTTSLNEYEEFTFAVKTINSTEIETLQKQGFRIKDLCYSPTFNGEIVVKVSKIPAEKYQHRINKVVKRAFEVLTN